MNSWNYLILFLGPLTGGIVGSHMVSHKEYRLKLILAFSGSFLFAVTVLSLIPEIYSESHGRETGIFVLAGFFFQIILEQFSKGVEHGHVHGIKKANTIPVSIFAGLSVHAFLEGIPLGGGIFSEDSVHYGLLFGIALHEMPAAFALMTIVKASALDKTRTYGLLMLYALMAPMGALLSTYLSGIDIFREGLLNNVMAVVIGIFLHISTTILFENSENHKFGRYKLIAVIIGAALAFLTVINGH